MTKKNAVLPSTVDQAPDGGVDHIGTRQKDISVIESLQGLILETKLKNFDSAGDVEGWIRNYMIVKQDWSDDKVFAVLPTCFEGEALDWFNMVNTRFKPNKDEFLKLFERKFLPEKQEEDKVRRIYEEMIAGPRGNFISFIYRLTTINMEAKLSYETILLNIKKFIPYRAEREVENIKSLEELCDLCSEKPNIFESFKKINFEQKNLKEKENLLKRNSGLKCHSINSSKKTECYISAKILDKDVSILVDTGASHSFIQKDFAETLGIPIRTYISKYVETATVKVKTCGLAKMKIQLGDDLFKERFNVLSNLQEKVILGHSFLEKHMVNINLKTREFVIGLNKIKLESKKLNCFNYTINFNKDTKQQGNHAVGVSHRIFINKNTPPINTRPYRISLDKEKAFKEILDKLLADNIIEESVSPWGSPYVLVPKKDGSLRLCINYQKINALMEKENSSPPCIQECFDRLASGKAKIYSRLDLKNGYHQVPMEHKSKKFTAFMTPWGKFQYRMMPFGLMNAPATFQNYMYHILKGCIGRNCIVYMDCWLDLP